VHQLKTNSDRCYFLSSRFRDRVIAKVIAHPWYRNCLYRKDGISIPTFGLWFTVRNVSTPLQYSRLTATFNLLCDQIACRVAREPFAASWCHYRAASRCDANRFAFIAAKRAVETKIARGMSCNAGNNAITRARLLCLLASKTASKIRAMPLCEMIPDDGTRRACIRRVPAHACDALILFRAGSFPGNARA